MKKHFTLLLLLLPLFMAGQSNFPLVKEGAVWRELKFGFAPALILIKSLNIV